MKTRYNNLKPFVTKDGSIIREIMHPALHGNARQSLAEAEVPIGKSTQLHRHLVSEEIYYITAGEGRMTLGNELFAVKRGDSICISPGTPHCIENTGDDVLRIICCCSPAYSHDDTVLEENAG